MFSEEDKDSSLASIIPGLQRLGKKEEEEDDDEWGGGRGGGAGGEHGGALCEFGRKR